ncbi:hypothetical protein [Thioflavicoccus mobilis]|uniref:hypothetical protein n=1 Tax=Thioflavicoccus mobilis TaxID=80679 RepID=UPI0012FBAB14|nr:hypothetical protein [Thioflavicoccus mobilis]
MSLSAGAWVPESNSDFAQIAKGGFTSTVDGSLFEDPWRKKGYPSLVTNLDGHAWNTYAWSGTVKDGSLYIGTNVNVACSAQAGGKGNISECANGPDEGAQIWKYTPSGSWAWGDWGLGGTWKLVYQSPAAIPAWLAPIVDSLVPDDSSELDLSFLTEIPRDFGYRGMTVCETNDRVERLYAVTLGFPGQVLYQDTTWWGGDTFNTASSDGLNASLLNAAFEGGDLDLGYRGLVCFKGRIVTAPAGSLTDPDVPITPTIIMNADPTNPSSRWETILDVANGVDGDPGNSGVFQIEVVGDNLYAATINRESGFELWRGDGSNCVEPWVDDGHCEIQWDRVIDNGGGRPADFLTQSYNTDVGGDPTLEDPGFQASGAATLGTFGNSLLVGGLESFFYGISFSEMIRVANAGNDALGDLQWELVVGWPRKDWGLFGGAAPEHFVCKKPGDMANSLADMTPDEQKFWRLLAWNAYGGSDSSYASPEDVPEGLITSIPLDDDTGVDDCFPNSGAGPGYGTNWFSETPEVQAYTVGPYGYFWRFKEFLGGLKPEVYVGPFDIDALYGFADSFEQPEGYEFKAFGEGGYLKDGFDLLSTPASERTFGRSFHFVTTDGFGSGGAGSNAYGVRTLEEIPGVGLVVGTASADEEQGTDIYIGTRRPSRVPPYADAGPDQLISWDDPEAEIPAPVVATLNAGGSHSSFDGGTPVSCEWFEGEADANCEGDLDRLSNSAPCNEDVVTGELPTLVDEDQNPQYPYTVKVTATENGRFACDTMVVTASSNRSPTASLDTGDVGPDTLLSNFEDFPEPYVDGTRPRVAQIDFDDDGSESYAVTGVCDDPDGGPITTCEFEVRDTGNSISDQQVSCAGGETELPADGPCTVTATITTLTPAEIQAIGGGQSSPDMYLVVRDEDLRTRVRWESTTREIQDDATDDDGVTPVNDDPECRTVTIQVAQGSGDNLIDPAIALADGNPICVDPETDTMTYKIRGSQYGPYLGGSSATGGDVITYNPGAESAGSFDKFEFRATDPSDGKSLWVSMVVEIVTPSP